MSRVHRAHVHVRIRRLAGGSAAKWEGSAGRGILRRVYMDATLFALPLFMTLNQFLASLLVGSGLRGAVQGEHAALEKGIIHAIAHHG